MNRKIFFILILLPILELHFSCTSHLKVSTYAYDTSQPGGKVDRIITLKITPPKGYIEREKHLEFEISGYIYKYPDGAIFYVSEQGNVGYGINKQNRLKKYGKDPLDKGLIDTLDLKGQSQNKKYWRDKKIFDLQIGYSGVSLKRLDEFNQAIDKAKQKVIPYETNMR